MIVDGRSSECSTSSRIAWATLWVNRVTRVRSMVPLQEVAAVAMVEASRWTARAAITQPAARDGRAFVDAGRDG